MDVCPNCKSRSIEGKAFDLDDDWASQKVFCHECGSSWEEVYVFIGIRNEDFKGGTA